MKKLSILALSATLMTAPAFAQSNAHYSTTNLPTQPVDLSAVFDNSQDLQVAVLSQKEMQETEGAWANFAIGAGLGVAGYALEHRISGKPMTWKGAAFAAGTGALTGGASGALVKAAGGGKAAASWAVNGIAANQGLNSYRRGKGW